MALALKTVQKSSIITSYDKMYIVGGGEKNQFLNRLTAEAIGKEFIVLPIEATALGTTCTPRSDT